MQRAAVNLNCSKGEKKIYMDFIFNIYPEKQMIVVYSHSYYLDIADDKRDRITRLFIPITIMNKKQFNLIKFEWIKYKKTLKNPEDRVADFECRGVDGMTDFDKRERLVEQRKTRAERQKEINDELILIKTMDDMKIDSTQIRKELKAKIQAT